MHDKKLTPDLPSFLFKSSAVSRRTRCAELISSKNIRDRYTSFTSRVSGISHRIFHRNHPHQGVTEEQEQVVHQQRIKN
jgi:hypothetical protein